MSIDKTSLAQMLEQEIERTKLCIKLRCRVAHLEADLARAEFRAAIAEHQTLLNSLAKGSK